MIWTGRGEITYEDKVLVGKPESRLQRELQWHNVHTLLCKNRSAGSKAENGAAETHAINTEFSRVTLFPQEGKVYKNTSISVYELPILSHILLYENLSLKYLLHDAYSNSQIITSKHHTLYNDKRLKCEITAWLPCEILFVALGLMPATKGKLGIQNLLWIHQNLIYTLCMKSCL